MKSLPLIILIVFSVGSVSAFSVLVNEPVNTISTAIQPYFHTGGLNPFGDTQDVFVGQSISGQLHPSSQFFSGTGNFGSYPEVCDANGNLNQVFDSLSYPVANIFPQAPASGGVINIAPADIVAGGIIPPSGYHFECINPPFSGWGAYLGAMPNGFGQFNLGTQWGAGISYPQSLNSCIYITANAGSWAMTAISIPSFNILSSVTCPSPGWCCLSGSQNYGIPITPNQIIQYSICRTSGINQCDVRMIIG